MIFLCVYLGIALLAWRPVAGHMAWDGKLPHQDYPDSGDWLFSGFLGGAVVCGLWPLLLILMLLKSATFMSVGAEREVLTREKRQAKQKRQEQELREAHAEQQRLASLVAQYEKGAL